MATVDRSLVIALHLYNYGIQKARREYRQHPLADTPHGPGCAAEGCQDGWAVVRRRSAYIRAYRARRRAQGKTS